jgi:hypothetical protein
MGDAGVTALVATQKLFLMVGEGRWCDWDTVPHSHNLDRTQRCSFRDTIRKQDCLFATLQSLGERGVQGATEDVAIATSEFRLHDPRYPRQIMIMLVDSSPAT